MTAASKLYIVVLRSLVGMLKAAQACHALRQFIFLYPDIEDEWFSTSNNIVILEHDDLAGTAVHLEALGMSVARFHEPDRGGELTAICVDPRAAHELRRYPLAA